MARLVHESPHWIGVLAHPGDGRMVIHLSAVPQRRRLGQVPPERVDWLAVLDLDRGRWEITPATG